MTYDSSSYYSLQYRQQTEVQLAVTTHKQVTLSGTVPWTRLTGLIDMHGYQKGCQCLNEGSIRVIGVSSLAEAFLFPSNLHCTSNFQHLESASIYNKMMVNLGPLACNLTNIAYNLCSLSWDCHYIDLRIKKNPPMIQLKIAELPSGNTCTILSLFMLMPFAIIHLENLLVWTRKLIEFSRS